jgi:multiple sugar transport system substrate-binding protein
LRIAAAALAGAVLGAMSGAALAQEKLVVWFTKGFYPAEDKALETMIYRFEQKTGVKVELSLFAVQDIMPKTVAALDAGTVPDVSFGLTYDFQAAGKWAFEGKLADLSDILAPMKDRFLPNTLSTAFLYNDKTKKKAYYAFPVYQQTIHVNYWKDMLAEAGFKDSDIPQDWKGYWSFWCDKVQPAHRQKSGKRTFAIGHPMGVDATDSFFSFYQFLIAHNAKLVDDAGKLVIDLPKNRANAVAALKDYTDVLTKGCTPPSSTNWKDPDNNVAFHNKTTVMTHNATISLPAKWFDDMNNAALTPEQRATAKKNYDELIATTGWPKKVDGSPMSYLAAIKLGAIFEGAKNPKRAKEFVAFMMEDSNLIPYTEGALGRWFPTTKAGAARDFWKADAHRRTVLKQFTEGTSPFPFVYNYKFTILNNENVWAKAMSRVTNDKWTPEKAVDEMIARIKAVAG